MDADTRKHLRWIELFLKTKNQSLTCLKCGISRPSERYEQQGVQGLSGRSKRPISSPAVKISELQRTWIRELRKRNLGSRRIQNELRRVHGFEVSRTTIDKALKSIDIARVARPRPSRKGRTRYAKEIPGERVQMDTCKIGPGLYQYTAVDDCTRIRVLALYPRRTAANSLLFLEYVIEEIPFPIQAIQTDRGREFFTYCFQEKLMEYAIKFRPVKPASPHLNGKVERSQRTDIEEFYSTVDLKSPKLSLELQSWQDHYNQDRPHGSLSGRTPWEVWSVLVLTTPLHEDVEAAYDASAERIRNADYRLDLQLGRVGNQTRKNIT